MLTDSDTAVVQGALAILEVNSLDALNEGIRTELLVKCFKWIAEQRGWLPKEAYFARCRAFPIVYMEMITFYQNGDDMEVLLDMRPPEDPFYPNMYGTQGGTLMIEQTYQETLDKHVKKESKIPFSDSEQPIFAGVVSTPFTERDHAVTVVFCRSIHKKPEKFGGTFIPMEEYVDANVAPSCRDYVDLAYKVFLGQKPDFVEHQGHGA